MLLEKPSVSQLIVLYNPARFYVTRLLRSLPVFHRGKKRKEHLILSLLTDGQEMHYNINSFAPKRFAVRKCRNAMQKEKLRFTLLQTTNVRFKLTISQITNKLIIKNCSIQSNVLDESGRETSYFEF